ncbi:MAG TPA: Txe/YoeB family addiction module toxin [Saprospiraceae bacterium]|nr:Txe/YoeB family addiction module toxin [Saprospiraceae bacterium]
MKVEIDEQFEKDLRRLRTEDAKLTWKIWELLFDLYRTPFDGIGKPEPLKSGYRGCWSRRIDQKHRLIYRIENDIVTLISCFGHYDDD